MPSDNRLQLTHCLLTYSQSSLDKTALANHLFSLPTVKAVKVAKETHEDGGFHFHAYVLFAKAKKIQPSFFDLEGEHPNIKSISQKVGFAGPAIAYLDKEDTEPIILPDGYVFNSKNKRGFKEVAGDALQAASKKEALAIIMRDNPDKWLIYADQIERNLDKRFRPAKPVFVPRPLESFNIPVAISNWASRNLVHPRPERPQALILVGATRLGKTQLARAYGDHIYVCNMWCVDDFVGWDWNGYVVFDDIPWDSFKYSYKAWMGGQKHFYVTDKYRKKVLMEGGAPLIICCNQDDYEEYQKNWNTDWVFGNSVVVTIGNKLY